ncbi:hypothetical protein HDU91_005525 [Kappamyces sp. JEL0680]|nr:hypothetical protein HDU91_005525 [Kappamyces sp. JEL0680]
MNQQFLAKLLQDENSLYFLVSIVWATGKPVKVSLIPYATFSLFHTLGYIRTELIPKVFPGAALGKTISTQINKFMVAYQPLSINLVARAEVWVILPMSIISIFWGGISIFTPFLFSQFLQFRFIQAPPTRQALAETEVFLDKWILAQPSVPPLVKTGYSKLKELIQKYMNLEERARQAQAAQTPPQ